MDNKISCSVNSYGLNQFKEILRDIAGIGFHSIELSCEQSRPLAISPERLFNFSHAPDAYNFSNVGVGEMIKSFGLNCGSINACCELCHPKAVEILRRRVELAHLLNVPLLTTGIGKGWEQEERRETACDNLRMVCNYARQFNITICLKTDAWLTQNSKEAKDTLKKIESQNLKIDFDPANIIYYNDKINISEYLLAIAGKIGCVQLRGSSGKMGDKNFPAIGEGIIDYKGIFDILNKNGFYGPFCLDLENAYLWEPDAKQIPLTHSYWQSKKFDREGLEIHSKKIQKSLDYLKKVTNIII